MTPERALDIRAKIADYRRTGVGMLDDVMTAFLDILDGKDTLPAETPTLRDKFAMAALPAIITTVADEADYVAARAYDIADSMLSMRAPETGEDE